MGMNPKRIGLTALIALLTACSGSAPSLNRSPAPLVDFAPSMVVSTAWTANVGKSGSYIFTPVQAGPTVVAASADGMLTRIEIGSGRAIWRTDAGMPLTAGVGSDGSTVVVAGAEGAILAFDMEGRQRWKAQASSEILSAPAVGQGLVIVRSVDNRIAAYDARTGVRRWQTERNMPALSLHGAPGIVIAGSQAFVGLPGGRLLALALQNGAALWEAAIGNPRGTNDLERIADVTGSPLVDAGQVCAVAYQGRIGCLDARTGAARWSQPVSSAAGLGGDARFVFTADERGTVYAFTRNDGRLIWKNEQLANRSLSAPVSFGQAVVVVDGQGYVHFLSREEGKMLARVAGDGGAVAAAPVIGGSHLIFQTKAGKLVALTTE